MNQHPLPYGLMALAVLFGNEKGASSRKIGLQVGVLSGHVELFLHYI